MKEILLTGYDKKQFNEVVEKAEHGGCYLCKRSRESVFFRVEDGEEEVCDIDLKFRLFEFVRDKKVFTIPLCAECFMFLEEFAKQFLFLKELGSEFHKGVEDEQDSED